MGVLVYGGHQVIEFEDRLLAHLQIVAGLKLRRREGFYLTWREDTNAGSGRVTIWVDPALPLMFRYEEGAALSINREWLESLTLASNSARGLVVTEETAHLTTESAEAF
ncbi:ATP-dependent DNA ligase [Leifsonia sp. NPDC058292]|uniref:DUF7882 family protein n=1 Tax=Leifsonia sp. NPDC058292 TaxID=3346428 RepID=UPI0036D9AB45